MELLADSTQLRARVAGWRRAGERVAFVPTMGNLHAGHYSLVDIARTRADRVVASIFVNPTQFGPNEDFASYPRTPDDDREGLRAVHCDLVFTPDVREIYPFGTGAGVRVDVPAIADALEGALRPGHFAGVATVVTKLFNRVQPDVAVFGQKDYQQLLLIRRLVCDLGLPIEIVAGPTVREPSGLAMSSRNQYLGVDERQRASAIYRVLQQMAVEVRGGHSHREVEERARQTLDSDGLAVQYAAVRDAADLSESESARRTGLVALIAARLGRARLIDNVLIDL